MALPFLEHGLEKDNIPSLKTIFIPLDQTQKEDRMLQISIISAKKL